MAVGLVMLLWCLSGFVMMYHGYPRLPEGERLGALQPIRLAHACNAAALDLSGDRRLRALALEMRDDVPVLELDPVDGAPRFYDLDACRTAGPVTAAQARRIAAALAAAQGLQGRLRDQGEIASDQWTVNGASRRGPVRRFSLDGFAGDDVYVAVRDGRVAQHTTRMDRVLGWLGAVPHWLYPTLLRRNGELWSQVVIWTSLLGVFLTAIGLYLGLARLRRYRTGRWSPYRGWGYVHHLAGLAFGVLTLTWIGSGLLTMSPWGLLESPAFGEWRSRVSGEVAAVDVPRALAALARRGGAGWVRIEAAPLSGRLFLLAHAADGSVVRLDEEAASAPMAAGELSQALAQAANGAGVVTTVMTRQDAYFYPGYDEPAPLPVIRAEVRDRYRIRLYLDPVSGVLLRVIDRSARLSRWTRTALHDWDLPGLRARPLWDVVVLSLLAGVTSVCASGAWLAFRRAGIDVQRLWSAALAFRRGKARARSPREN